MLKTNTNEQRALKRSKRLQKKLKVGDFKELTYLIFAKMQVPSDTNTSNDEPIFTIMNGICDAVEKINGRASYVTSKLINIDGKPYIEIDGCLNLFANTDKQQIVDVFSEYANQSLSFIISEGKDSNYDPIWAKEDCLEFDPNTWGTIIHKQ